MSGVTPINSYAGPAVDRAAPPRPIFMPERVTLEDIAERIAKINRFAGGTKLFYSVAQHCVIVAEAMADDPRAAIYGLLHDAHEAWTSDIPSTVKAEINRLAQRDVMPIIEGCCDAVIFPALGLDWPMPLPIAARVRDMDGRAFLTEDRDVALPLVVRVSPLTNPFSKPITQCWPWPKAEENFIECFDRFAALTDLPPRKRRLAR